MLMQASADAAAAASVDDAAAVVDATAAAFADTVNVAEHYAAQLYAQGPAAI